MKKTVIAIVTLFIFSVIYFAPYFTAYQLRQDVINNDKASFNATVDFSSIQKNIKNEIDKQIQDMPNSSNLFTNADKLAKNVANNVGNSTRLFDSLFFSTFKVRHKQIYIKARYVGLDRFYVSFNDKNRPFTYPEWTFCKKNLFIWRLCGLSLPSRINLYNKDGGLDEIFDIEKKLQKTDIKFIISDQFTVVPDHILTMIEFSNIVEKVYGQSKFDVDLKEKIVTISIDNNEYKLYPAANFSDGDRGYLLYDKIKKEKESYADCHACTGNLSLVIYKLTQNGIEIISQQDDLIQEGVWGRSGTVIPVTYDKDSQKQGIIIYNGSMWQGYAVTWLTAYKIDNNKLVEEKSLAKSVEVSPKLDKKLKK